MMTTVEGTLQEVDAVLQTLSQIESATEPELAAIPGLNNIVPFLRLFKLAASGVDLIAKATNGTFEEAKAAAEDHNTPGAPNAPALS